jgi:hypothetical protein
MSISIIPLFIALCLCACCEKKEEMEPEAKVISFKPKEKIQRIAEAYSLDAIDVAQSNLKIKWTGQIQALSKLR